MAPEVFSGIAALVVIVVLAHRIVATWVGLASTLPGRAPGRARGVGAAAAVASLPGRTIQRSVRRALRRRRGE